MSEGEELAPYDLTAEPKAHVFLQPGWAERLEELAPRSRPIYFSPLRNSLVIREGFAVEKRGAEMRGHREWIEGISRRLGLVAEVHRCHVERSVYGPQWAWSCARPDCGEFRVYRPTQAAAFAEALAHARSFVPQPPEPGRWSELDWTVYKVFVARNENAVRRLTCGE